MLFIGHRGAKALEPENTLLAFERGIQEGANAIEFDVRASKDGRLVVMHDESIDRTTNGKGSVKDFLLKELKEFDAGKGQKIPSLEEAIDFLKGKKVLMVIELKEEGLEEKTVELICRLKAREKALVSSFILPAIRKVKELDSGIKTCALFREPVDGLAGKALQAKANYVFAFKGLASKELIDECHEKSLKFMAWNPNALDEMKLLLALGIDGIASDNPSLFKELKSFVA